MASGVLARDVELETAALAEARSLFDPAPGVVYLDAATYGLPPRPTVAALEHALRRWQSGEAEWVNDWDRIGESCRQHFATLIGGDARSVALVPTVSVGVGLVAASLPAGIEIVIPDDEFTSVLYPLLVAAARRDVRLRRVPFGELAAAIDDRTGMVAFSLTRSQDGLTAPLGDIVTAAQRVGAQVLVDATHAIPFVPVAPWLSGIDYLICHGYKHLLCPRGVGFCYIREDRWPGIDPWLANWRTGDPLYGHSFGGTLDDLTTDARRFDVSLAWHAWVGAEPSLSLLVDWQRQGLFDAVRVLSRRLAAGLGQAEPGASIVSVAVDDAEAVEAALGEAGLRCAARGGNVRLSPHVYNTLQEIDYAIECVARFVA